MDGITIEDIARFYPNIEDAEVAFSLFDKDQNGDVSRDEIEMSCLCVSLPSSFLTSRRKRRSQ